MDEQRFKREMAKAQAFRKIGENPDYWRGFIRGLRRRYHGEDFGTAEEHRTWMAMIDDEYRKELGRGYRDGFYFN